MENRAEVVSFRGASRVADGANRKALRRIRARVIGIQKDGTSASGLTDSKVDPGKSETPPEEPFYSLAEKGLIIEPPFDLLTLAMLVEHNSELNQCVEAMETNIDGTGYRFVSRLKLDDIPRDNPPSSGGDAPPQEQSLELIAAKEEKTRLANFFTYSTEESFVAFRRKLRRDLETTGNGYFEVLRNRSGEIQGFTHMPSYQMRIGRLETEPHLVERKILELQSDGSVQIKTQKVWRRFRRYVQSRAIQQGAFHALEGHKTRWYKAFGDARDVDKHDGHYATAKKPVKAGNRATEIVHMKLYSPRSPYGLPRYIGNLLSIFGDRAAEEINYITFRNNNIPSMVVCASNGQLTQGTIDRIQDFVQSQIQGSDNYSKFLIIEAEPFGEDGEDGGQVKVDVRPLTNDQHKDALFQNYSKNNQDKIRRAFRIPPILVGRSDDYTRATADASRRLADEQIFGPERDEFDAMVNRFIFPEMGIRFHRFRSNSPNTTDNQQLVRILAGAEKTGGMTPRIARSILEDNILSIDLPDFPNGFPADMPFSLTMAEAVKNKADGSEPGQQVTALKAIEMLTGDGLLPDDDDDESLMAVAKRLMALQRAAEVAWRAKLAQKGELDGSEAESE